MRFFQRSKRDSISNHNESYNHQLGKFDLATKSVAVAASRRRFLGKVPFITAAIASLSFAALPEKANAGTCCSVTYNCPNRSTTCENCSDGRKRAKTTTWNFVCGEFCDFACNPRSTYGPCLTHCAD